MPGKPIREYYLENGGVPAFGSVYQDATGNAKEILLALAKGNGFTRSGLMEVSFKEETELDLYIEQFLLPLMIHGIRLSFDALIENGCQPESTLMELYASGEIGELFMMAAEKGVYQVWRDNASPTCQYGIFRNLEKILPKEETKKRIHQVLEEIRDGSFLSDLSQEASQGYKNLKAYDYENEESQITKTQNRLREILKYRHHK